jgi:hypothetical protein
MKRVVEDILDSSERVQNFWDRDRNGTREGISIRNPLAFQTFFHFAWREEGEAGIGAVLTRRKSLA